MRTRPWHFVLVLVTLLATACDPGSFSSKANDSESPAPQSVIQKHIVWETDKTIKPTAILLHWTASYNGGPDAISAFVTGAEGNMSTYNPELTSKEEHPEVGHVTVQVAVMGNGKAYQLTPETHSFARHAKCGNPWAIGIEIEGWNPGHEHYIGDNLPQFDTVVAVVKELMAKYNIKAESVVAKDGRSGRGIVTHAQVDQYCTWKDGEYAGDHKSDVDPEYFGRVMAAVK